MPTPSERYHAALADARERALVLTQEQERELLELLEEYAREIEARVAGGLRFGTDAAVLREIALLVDAMTGEMAASVGDGVRLTAREVAEIQALATAELIAAAGSSLSVAAAFSGTGARAAQAILARPELAEAFVSIQAEAKQAANRILRRGILRGAPAQAIARELRQFVAMPDSLLEGDVDLLADRRRIGYRQVQELGYDPTPENLALVRQGASRIAYRASTIARTEIANAELEALVQGAIDSPVVALVHWRLSYTHPVRDNCDLLAERDFYGHGPGLYDPRRAPARPHPRCRCVISHRLRDPSEWGAERGPARERQLDPATVAEEEGFSPSIVRQLQRAVSVGDRRQTREPVGV